MQIATGQIEDAPLKDSAAVSRGRIGGEARAKLLSKTKKKRIARTAADRRWGRSPKKL
jgi:hypothetical protein